MGALTTFDGIKKGQKFRIIGNSNGHNYPTDEILIFKRNGGIGKHSMNDAAMREDDDEEGTHFTGNTLEARDCVLLGVSLDDLRKELMQLKTEYTVRTDDLRDKIKFCEDNKMEEYDEDAVTVHRALSVLNNRSATDAEKAQIITKLIRDIR